MERFFPELRLEVRSVRFDGIDQLTLRGVRLRTAAGEQVLAAKRLVLRYSPWSLRDGHVDLVLLERPLVTPPTTLPTFGEGGGTTWSIGRLVARGGRMRIPARGELPAASFRFATDLHDVGDTPALAERVHRLAVKDVRLTPRGGSAVLAMRAATVEASLTGLRDHHRIDSVRLTGPSVRLAGTLPAIPAGAGEPADPPWSIGRREASGGRVAVGPSSTRPGVAFRVTTTLDELGATGEAAARPQEITARQVGVTLPGGTQPALALDAAVAHFSVAGLRDRRIDEV